MKKATTSNEHKISQLLLAAEILENNYAFLFKFVGCDIWHRGDFDQKPAEKDLKGDLNRLETNIFQKVYKRVEGFTRPRNAKEKLLTPDYLRLAAQCVENPFEFRISVWSPWRVGVDLEENIRNIHELRLKN